MNIKFIITRSVSNTRFNDITNRMDVDEYYTLSAVIECKSIYFPTLSTLQVLRSEKEVYDTIVLCSDILNNKNLALLNVKHKMKIVNDVARYKIDEKRNCRYKTIVDDSRVAGKPGSHLVTRPWNKING